jgi:response regulator RpfG family c-di-GMP phosphodiesterase
MTVAEVLEITRQRSGSMYDPHVVETFVRVHREIAPITCRSRRLRSRAAPLVLASRVHATG